MNTESADNGSNNEITHTNNASAPVQPQPGALPAAAQPKKESWVAICPLCPSCGEPMRMGPKAWKCLIISKEGKEPRGCGKSDTDGQWRVEYFPTIPTLNKKEKIRHNELTLETWPNQKAAEERETDLKNHFRNTVVVPTQQTWLTEQQCRASELFFKNHSMPQLEFSAKLHAVIKDSALKAPEDLIGFITAHKSCGIKCSPMGIIEYIKVTKWSGDMTPKPDFVHALQIAVRHRSGGYGGHQPLSESAISKCKSQDAYIMAYFQPNYPEVTSPDCFMDKEIERFCFYSFNTPRRGMPLTEMEKWHKACELAKIDGSQPPVQPVEEAVYKLIEDGKDENGSIRWKKVPGELDYDRPWPRTVANGFLIRCRALRNLMAQETLCGEPAGWTPHGDKLKEYTGSKEELAAEAKVRAKNHRVLNTVEKLRILNWSIKVDGGCGAASVLWQGWGGGRRADVERYCLENFNRDQGKIQIGRHQTKNESCKDVTPMVNFYTMAHMLIGIGLWTEENFKDGFSDMTRMKILAKSGFWEESWGMRLSVEDSRAGEDFDYQLFDNEDILDLPELVELLRTHKTLTTAFVWGGFVDAEKQLLIDYRRSDKAQNAVRKVIVRRLNEIMSGSHYHTEALFEGVKLRKRTADLLQRKPTGPNLRYLNRLQLEDIFQELLAKRQNYPHNALRRSGMSAMYQVFESKDGTITYFSTGGTSWEEAYKTSYSKQLAREHWQILYSFMDKSYNEDDRNAFLPAGHKLADFRTSEVIDTEKKNDRLAEEYNVANPAEEPCEPSNRKKRTAYSDQEKAAFVAEYLALEGTVSQKLFAEQRGLSPGVFHRWLEVAGVTQKLRSKEEIAKIIEGYLASGMEAAAYAASLGIPYRTFWSYLETAGLTETTAKRHTPKESAQHVVQWRASGKTRQDYADEQGIDRTTLGNWINKVDSGPTAADNGMASEASDLVAQCKFTEEQYAALIADYLASPLETTQEEFAKANGIGLKTFTVKLAKAGKTTPRRSKEEIAKYVRQYHAGNMTKWAFAEVIGVSYETLLRWLKAAEPEQG